MLAAGGLGGWGGACRSPIGMDWARMMIALITMQGLGKPGINLWSTTQELPPIRTSSSRLCGRRHFGRLRQLGRRGTFCIPHVRRGQPPVLQQHQQPGRRAYPPLKIPECIMDGKYGPWYGKGFVGGAIEQQFKEYRYPEPDIPPSRCTTSTAGLISEPWRNQPLCEDVPHQEPSHSRQPGDLV
jgi:trimethylamine-N-oxide reductase (cytochrome c)